MNWIYDLIRYLRNLFPRVCFVQPDEGGVMITLGKHIKKLTSGWYVYWPIIQSPRIILTSIHVADLQPQSVVTKDGKTVTISGGIKYHVVDPEKAILHICGWMESIQILALGIIAEYVSSLNYNDLLKIKNIVDATFSGIRKEAGDIGMEILAVYITDIGIARNIRLLGNK